MSVPPEEASARPARSRPMPRPDELSDDVCEFLSAVDEYKRSNMRSFLSFDEIFQVFDLLGYVHSGGDDAPEALSDAIDAYKERQGRLFPTWSEIFELARGLGWERQAG